MALRSKLKKVEDALASLSYEGVVLLGSLLTFSVLYTRLPKDDYGVLVGVAGLSGTTSLALVSWCQPWLLEAVLKHGRPLGDCVRRILAIATVATLACAAITVALGSFLVPKAHLPVLVAGGMADGLANGIGFVLAGVIHLRSTYVRATLTRAAIVLVRPVVVVVMLVTGTISLERYLVGVAVLFVVVVGALWWSIRDVTRPAADAEPFALPTRMVVNEGAQYGVVSLTWALQEDFDKTLLNTFGYADDAATYAGGYKFVQMATLPIKAVVSASHHRFLNPDDAPRTHLRRAVKLTALSVLYGIGATVALWVGLAIIHRYAYDQFGDAISPARWLSGLIVLRAFVWYPFNALLAFELRKRRMGILLTTSILNLGLNLALIPHFSWKAALVSTYLTEVVFGVLSWVSVVQAVRRAELAEARQAAIRLARGAEAEAEALLPAVLRPHPSRGLPLPGVHPSSDLPGLPDIPDVPYLPESNHP